MRGLPPLFIIGCDRPSGVGLSPRALVVSTAQDQAYPDI